MHHLIKTGSFFLLAVLFFTYTPVNYNAPSYTGRAEKINNLLSEKKYTEALEYIEIITEEIDTWEYPRFLLISINNNMPLEVIQFLIVKVVKYSDFYIQDLQHALCLLLTHKGNRISDGSYLWTMHSSISTEKKIQIMDLIFQQGLSPNMYDPNTNILLLFYAISNQQPKAIIEYLISKGANPLLKPLKNYTAYTLKGKPVASLVELAVETMREGHSISEVILENFKFIISLPYSKTLFNSSSLTKLNEHIYDQELIIIKTQEVSERE